MSDTQPPSRYDITYEGFLDDAVRDPDAYGLTLEVATRSRDGHYTAQGVEIPPVPKLNENLFSKLPSFTELDCLPRISL